MEESKPREGKEILKNRAFVMIMSFIAILLTQISDLGAKSPYAISFSSNLVNQGNVVLIKVQVKNGEIPHVSWMDKKIPLVANSQKTDWYGFLGADLISKPGTYEVHLRVIPSGYKRHFEVRVIEKDYGIRQLTLPKNMVDLDAETLKRARQESRIMRSLWEAPSSDPLWNGPFLMPLSGEIMGNFGLRSIINDQTRSPHSGVDLRAEAGTPVRAINNGRVVLVADHFFSGRSIVLDHGGGIQSMYFHLEKILVGKDRPVNKGDIIGLVGSTGRSTGPHLHWGIRVNGARVEPLELIELSKQLQE
ncbi:MAG: M23 family metallopeptidase [Pseudomonadota bacterium]